MFRQIASIKPTSEATVHLGGVRKLVIALAMAVALNFAHVAGGAFLLGVGQAHAVEPGEVLPDKSLEQRARGLSAKLRCLVCQNQSIDDSNAPLAKDLRLVVRERLTKGDTDEDVLTYVVARYGEFVLLTPPFKASTLLLWLAPVLCLAGIAYALLRASGAFGGAAGLLLAGRASERLTAEEERRLAELLSKPDKSG